LLTNTASNYLNFITKDNFLRYNKLPLVIKRDLDLDFTVTGFTGFTGFCVILKIPNPRRVLGIHVGNWNGQSGATMILQSDNI
jgi:hypothetical protein